MEGGGGEGYTETKGIKVYKRVPLLFIIIK